MESGETCFSLTEKLRPLFEMYGEEQIVASLYFLLQRNYIEDEAILSIDFAEVSKQRMDDLEQLHNRWVAQNLGNE